MEKIKINGEELNITFNLATELAYEEVTNTPFDASDIFKENKVNTKALVYASIACVIANNPDAKTDADYILRQATREEVNELVKTTTTALIDWLNIPAISDAHVKKSKSAKSSKNA